MLARRSAIAKNGATVNPHSIRQPRNCLRNSARNDLVWFRLKPQGDLSRIVQPYALHHLQSLLAATQLNVLILAGTARKSPIPRWHL
ncbi:MAG: hypothetical protein CL681_21700 [Blastopirellula sp.]|nr:hypothetical protein [Blastopirellula sp.]